MRCSDDAPFTARKQDRQAIRNLHGTNMVSAASDGAIRSLLAP
jgi:hypothetical protein